MGAKLILSYHGRPLGEHALTEGSTTIGRKPDNHLRLNDRAVSAHHSRIVTAAGQAVIEDLDSTNGTFVNGTMTHKVPLHDGDIVRIGEHELQYVTDAPTGQHAYDSTIVLGSSAATSAPSPAKGSARRYVPTEDAARSQGQAKLVILDGPRAGHPLRLLKAVTTIGKPGVQVAAVSRRPSGYYLVPIAGGTGKNHPPTVNGRPVVARARELHDHDILEIAGVRMEFFVGQAASPGS